MQNTFLRHQLQTLSKQAIGLNKKLWREQTVWQKVTKGGAWTLTPESNSMTISGNLKLAVVTEHGVETQDRLSSLLLKDTEKLRFSWTHQRKPACVWTVCSLAANGLFGIFAQGSALQVRRKRGGITKWGKHDRCLKLGFTVPMRKQVHITRLGENDFCWPPQLSLIQAKQGRMETVLKWHAQPLLSRGRGVHKNSDTRSLPAFQVLRASLASPDSAELTIKGRQSVTSSQRQETLPRAREPCPFSLAPEWERLGSAPAWVWNPSLSLSFFPFLSFFFSFFPFQQLTQVMKTSKLPAWKLWFGKWPSTIRESEHPLST